MESSIKYTYLRNSRHKLCTYADTDQVCRIVKRCQIIALLNSCDHFICDDCRGSKFLTAMDNTMSDSTNLFQTGDSTSLVICQCIQYHLDSLFVSRHGSLCDLFVIASFLGNKSSVDTDPLTKTFCKDCLCFRIDQLILQGRTSAVNYQYIHFSTLLKKYGNSFLSSQLQNMYLI